jgi:preprotein translocase subunit SecG
MPFAVLFVIFVVIVLIVRSQGGGGGLGGRSGLLARGLHARGIILQADQLATETSYMGQRFEVRNLTIDVEVPGRDPYVVTLRPMIPRIVEALPGATLDLRVHPSNPNNVEIVGPAGASDWIRAAAAVPGQTWAGPQMALSGASLPKGCGTVFVVLVGMSLATAAVLTFINEHRSSTAATHAAPPKATHAPPVTPPRGGSKAHPH